MTTIARIVGIDSPITEHLMHPKLVGSDVFGVELELEGCPVRLERGRTYDAVAGFPMPAGVTAHEDGSLRNNGIEFVTAPLSGAGLVSAVEGIMRVACDLQLRESGRAGLHVHINVLDLTVDQWIDFLKVYTLVEPLIYQWVGAGRRESIYCRPWYSVDRFDSDLRNFVGFLKRGVLDRLNSRYYGLNINSSSKHGTLEFRHMPDTMDAERIYTWINIIQTMKNYVRRNSVQDERVLNTSATTLAEEILGPMYRTLEWGEYESWFYHHTLPFYRSAFVGPVSTAAVEWTWGQVVPAEMNPGYRRFMERRATKPVEEPKPVAKKRKIPRPVPRPAVAPRANVVFVGELPAPIRADRMHQALDRLQVERARVRARGQFLEE